jgi:hypothetical protein
MYIVPWDRALSLVLVKKTSEKDSWRILSPAWKRRIIKIVALILSNVYVSRFICIIHTCYYTAHTVMCTCFVHTYIHYIQTVRIQDQLYCMYAF